MCARVAQTHHKNNGFFFLVFERHTHEGEHLFCFFSLTGYPTEDNNTEVGISYSFLWWQRLPDLALSPPPQGMSKEWAFLEQRKKATTKRNPKEKQQRGKERESTARMERDTKRTRQDEERERLHLDKCIQRIQGDELRQPAIIQNSTSSSLRFLSHFLSPISIFI